MAAVDAVAAEVIGELDRAGVRFLLLKGPALARTLYRDGEQRRYLDVDLLVEPHGTVTAAAVLGALGFVNLTAGAGVDDFAGAVPSDTWRRAGEMVDLHSRLPGCAATPDAAWPILFEGHGTIDIAGVEAPVLSRPGMALHLATHAAQHGPDDLKAMQDLERGLE